MQATINLFPEVRNYTPIRYKIPLCYRVRVRNPRLTDKYYYFEKSEKSIRWKSAFLRLVCMSECSNLRTSHVVSANVSKINRDRRRERAISRRARPPAAIDSIRPRDRTRSLARTRPRRGARVSDRSPVGVARAIGTAASVPSWSPNDTACPIACTRSTGPSGRGPARPRPGEGSRRSPTSACEAA